MKITVRTARDSEIPACRVLHDLAFDEHRKVYRFTGVTATQQDARFLQGTRLVALVNDKLAGTLQYRLDAAHIHLLGIAVHPQFRCSGVARALIDHVATLAPSLGHNTLALDTVLETGNVSCFERCGFAVTDEKILDDCESDLHERIHCVQMERSLRLP